MASPATNRSSSGSGSAAHTAGNEYHIGTLHHLFDILCALLGCLLAYFRLCSCAQSLGQLLTDLDGGRSLTELKCLLIGIDSDELYAADGLVNHSIYSIIACSADTDDDNLSSRLSFICHNF